LILPKRSLVVISKVDIVLTDTSFQLPRVASRAF